MHCLTQGVQVSRRKQSLGAESGSMTDANRSVNVNSRGIIRGPWLWRLSCSSTCPPCRIELVGTLTQYSPLRYGCKVGMSYTAGRYDALCPHAGTGHGDILLGNILAALCRLPLPRVGILTSIESRVLGRARTQSSSSHIQLNVSQRKDVLLYIFVAAVALRLLCIIQALQYLPSCCYSPVASTRTSLMIRLPVRSERYVTLSIQSCGLIVLRRGPPYSLQLTALSTIVR